MMTPRIALRRQRRRPGRLWLGILPLLLLAIAAALAECACRGLAAAFSKLAEWMEA